MLAKKIARPVLSKQGSSIVFTSCKDYKFDFNIGCHKFSVAKGMQLLPYPKLK